MALERTYNSLAEWEEAQKKKKKNQEEPKRTSNSLSEWEEAEENDIAPVKGGNKDSVFKSGGFSDGVDGVGDFLGDLGETVLGTVGDIGLGIVRGAGRLVEGVTDLGLYGASGLSRLFGADEEADRLKEAAQKNTVDAITQDAVDYVDQYSVLGDKADMVTEGLGQVGAIILTGGAAGAAGLGTVGATALTTGVTGLSGMGSGMSDAYEQGATDEEAFTYGLISGTAEAATELLFGGLGKASKAIGVGKSAVPLDDLLAKKVTSKFSSQIAKNFTEYGIKASAEGAEEVLSGILQAVGKKATYMDEKEFDEILKDENLLEQFVVGAVTSGIAQSGVVPGMKAGSLREANKTGRDFITGYTKSDQTIIDNEVASRVAEKEKNGKKLTKGEIGKIEEQVQSDLEKGYISIDTIESTFGGNSYTDWKNEVDNNKKLKAELDELRRMKTGDMNDIQTERLAELKGMNLDDTAKRDGLRKQLDDILKPQLEYSVLQESYNEKARRGQSFEADLTKIDEKQRATYERAINSGVLNNTNRSKEFVNVLAKIEADKGITFDFANNDKLKESGFAVEGKTVNGFAKDGAVTLNVEAAKSWQTVVGHEITHVLEGTEAYDGLREALYAYAESKGELESRKAELTELYKGVEDDIDAELTADLVGDYLFSDNDFIKHLTGNENVFKRIYNEIKYLCKVATGKQLTEVEKVKREFDKVWKEYNSTKPVAATNDTFDSAEPNVQFSLRKEAPPKETGIAYKVFFVKDGKLYPPMVANPDGADTPMGVWLDADVGQSAPPSKTGRQQVKAGGKGTQGGSGSLAFRPGWHLGDLPRASQFDRVNPETGKKELFPENFVWAEVEYAKDVDYQEEAMSYGYTENGKFRHAYAGLPKLPENGYYRYRTNPKPDTVPWIITGAMKVNRLLSDTEVNEILEKNGVPAVHRKGGDVGLDKFGFDESGQVQYSVSADSEGNQLSKEQSEYFKESKILDENGNLKVMHHGSPNQFTVFDVKKAKYAGTYGRGFYFSDSVSHAGTYGEIYDVYLNITNPLQNGTNEITKEQLRNFVEAIAENEDYGIENYGYDATVESVVESVYGKGDFGSILDLNITCIGDMVEAVKLFNEVNGTDYNGIVAPTETVAFYPEQIKEVGNQKPTADPDIRYSITQEADADYMKAVENGDMETAQLMVDEAAKNAGYTIKAYHGTPNTEFTVFDKGRVGKGNDQYGAGFYFASNREGATHYGNRVIDAALNITNPIRITADGNSGRNLIDADIELTSEQAYEVVKRHPDMYDAEESPLGDYFDSYWEEGAQEWMVESLAEQYRDVGYLDSDLFRNYPNELHEALRDVVGYDGIEVTFEATGDKFYIAWFDNQMKSVDPVTNDSNGNTIPLSERFNAENNDIRYSLSADSEGNALTVEQQNKFENSKVRDADGNLLTLYHGSESNAFTEFNMENGVWLTPDQRYSEVYAGKWHSWRDDVPELAYPRSDINGLEPEVYTDPDYRVYKVYADIQNPLNIGEIDGYLSDGKIGALARELGVRYSELNAIASKYMEEPTYRLTRSKEFIELAKSKGFDGLKATESGKETWCVIQSADQIKLTTNKTPTTNPDVRYSLSKEGETSPFGTPMNEMYYEPKQETAADDIAPVAENAPKVEAPMQTNDEMFADTYSEDLEKEMSQMDRNGFIDAVGDDIPQHSRREYEGLRDSVTIEEKILKHISNTIGKSLDLNRSAKKELREVVQKYSRNENATQNDLFVELKEKFGTQYDVYISDEIADAKKDIRETGVYVSPTEKAEFGGAKDYANWMRRHFNKINFRKDGIAVDVFYENLRSEYPALFSESNITSQDRLLRIAEVAETSAEELIPFSIPDEKLVELTLAIDNMVTDYHETERMVVSEENKVNWETLAPPPPESNVFSAPLRSDVSPMTEAEANAAQDAKVNADKTTPKSTRLADGSRGEELLVDSLDNYPMKTVEQKIAEKLRAIEGEIADNRDLRREAEANYNNQIAKLQEKYNAKKKKDTKTAYGIMQSISRLERLKASADANFAKRISDLEARVEKMNDPQYHRAMYRQAKMKEHADFAASILGDTSTWVDKKIGLQYSTNTERRNLRDIVRDANGNKDIARADAIDDALNGQYNREEAAKNRELAQTRGKYADLKITKAEDTYIQMLGEFRHNPETTLTQNVIDEYYQEHQNQIDTAKVDKVIEMARKDYDDWLNRVNAELRNQGMKEIPYRKGYFPHFTEPKQNFLQKLLNWKTQDNEIPTSIAGLTETFRPSKSWQSFDKTRYSDETDYSFMKGFDSYSQGVLDWIYHLDTLQKRRAVENHIRFTHSEEGIKQKIKEAYANEEMDANEVQAQIEHILSEAKNPLNNFVQDFTTHTNILAGKKNSLDRAVEQSTNRHIYSVMTNVQNRMSANMVLANVRSALTNFIPITQSWAQVSPLRSLQATKDTIKNAIKDDGLIDKSTFLTNRLKPADNLYKTGWDKVLDKAGIMFEVVDNFSSQVIWRSKYNQNISDGMTETEAIQNADQFAENVMAGRSKGNEPTLFNAKNPLVKAFTMFQLEVNNQYGYLFKDAPNDLKAETNHWKFNLAKGYTTAFIGAYVYNELLSKLTGSDAALDPIGIIEDLLNDLGFGDDEEKEPAEVVTNLMDNVVEELPFVGGLFGGGRIPISSALPYSDDGIKGAIEDISEGNWANVGKEMMNPLLNIGLPVGGGQIKKTTQGLGMFSDEHPVTGSYTDSGALRFPVEDTPANRVQAAIFGQYASENAREYFDNGYAPLKEKQIQEYTDVDLPIADYWKYREGLKGLKSNAEKADYINSLDIQDWQKNLLMNNILDRKEDVDMSNYSDYGSFEEFDFAQKYPNKHAFAKSVGGYSAYTEYKEALGDIKADKDEFGDTITGSRKEKVLNYINGLDADYETKLILFKSQYPSDDTYNHEIINYLNEREDISYEEMVSILTELGFTVKGNDIYWD